MAIVTTDSKHYKAIADKVREIKGTDETMLPSEMAQKVQEVYEKGQSEGGNTEEAYNQGVAYGKKAQYDEFWDRYQTNGTRTNYQGAFSGVGWNKTTFNPKYPIVANGANDRTFWTCRNPDLKKCTLDTSGMTSCSYMFQNTQITYIPTLDISKVDKDWGIGYMFANSQKLETIEKLIVSENTAYATTMFNADTGLKNLIFEGTIAKNNLTLSACTSLTHESLMSVINNLKDFTGTGTTMTVTLGTTNLAKLTDTEKAIATEKGWTLA